MHHYTMFETQFQSVATGPVKEYSSQSKSLCSTNGPFAADVLPHDSHILFSEGAKITHNKFNLG